MSRGSTLSHVKGGTPSHVLGGYPIPGPRGRGGYPISDLRSGGYPIPGLGRGGGRGYPISGLGGGYPLPPHLDLAGVPPNPSPGWGTPPARPGMGYPPQPDLGWGTPPTPYPRWGTPPPPSKWGLTHKVKILPSPILRMQAVINAKKIKEKNPPNTQTILILHNLIFILNTNI